MAIVLGGSLAAAAFVGNAHTSAVPSTAAPPTSTLGVGTTHGDLVVTAANSPYIITSLDPDASENVYYEQGNITVETGGTLEVVNTTLSFVSFVSQTGNITDQYSHLYHFTDLGGTILFNKANLTTDVAVLGAYPKLNL